MISIFWKMVDEERGFMERIEIPGEDTIYFDDKKGNIELAPMTEYIGEECMYYVDNVPVWTQELEDVAPNENGVMALFFVVPTDE